MRQDSAAAVKKVIDESAIKEAAARATGKAEADATLQEKLTATERTKVEAETAARGALTELTTLKAEHDKAISDRVQEARDAMDKDKTDALNAEKARYAEETQKLTGKLEALTRQLEKKTADELGEGAEVKLFDALRAEFEGDRIDRVGKGVSGADILHTVIHNGRECGTIIYDSKNSTAWRDDYRHQAGPGSDGREGGLRHPVDVASSRGAKQVDLRDNVIIVNPARAVAIAQIIRRHIVQVHALRLSKSERAKKMAALFDYHHLPRCAHLLDASTRTRRAAGAPGEGDEGARGALEEGGHAAEIDPEGEGRSSTTRSTRSSAPMTAADHDDDQPDTHRRPRPPDHRPAGAAARPTILRTYRTKVDIDDVVPNERQPRLGPKEDDELQRQIEANEGLFEPLLVEPHPDLPASSASSTASAAGRIPASSSGRGASSTGRSPSRSPTAR